MITAQTPINAEKNICEKCNFKCNKKSEFNRHILTAKHKRVINDNKKTPINAKTKVCACGKSFIYSSGLSRHKKKCLVDNQSIVIPNESQSMIDILSQNKELMNLLIIQNQEHREETSKLQNTLLELAPQIGNNNNNTTNNNQFNLQLFLNEDCKDALNFSEFIETIKVSFEDLENQAENGYVKGISKLFIENLQSLGINKRPIHCTDKKRKTLYIKENDAWDKEGSQDTLKKGIREVTGRTYGELIKSQAENEEEYKDADSVFSNKCLIIQQNLVPAYPRETSIGKVIENISKNTGIL
jgi:hypothetical protein